MELDRVDRRPKRGDLDAHEMTVVPSPQDHPASRLRR